MKKELLININYTIDHVLHVLHAFEDDQFHIVPFEGSWTAAQVAEHLLKSDTGILKILYGKVAQTKRAPDEKVAAITQLFSDFNLKMKSSEAILPSPRPPEKEVLLSALDHKMNALSEAAATLNVSATCLDFDLPGFGRLTILEWLTFFMSHTQRHTHQLEQIYRMLHDTSCPAFQIRTI